MKKIILGILLIGAVSFPLACGGNNNSPLAPPSSPPGPTSTPTPTFTVCANALGTPCTGTPTPTPTFSPTITFTPTATATPPTEPVSFACAGIIDLEAIRYSTGGNLWVTDYSNNLLQEWTTNGGAVTTVSTFNSGATFKAPKYMGMDPVTGNVYVTDSGHHQFVVFSSAVSYLATFGATEFSTHQTSGVAVNSAGTTVYCLDGSNYQLLLYSIGGTPSSPTYTYQSTIALTNITSPSNLIFDSVGNIWIGSPGNNTIVEFNSAGVYQKSITLINSGTPEDIAVDGSGNVYAADRFNSEIQEFNSSGQLINSFGYTPGFAPYGLTLDPTETYLYIAIFASTPESIVGFKVK